MTLDRAPATPRGRRRARTAATWLVVAPLVAVPIALYAWYVWAYGVNTVFWDQWHVVRLLQLQGGGRLGWTALWAQHNQNRMLFPNLVMIGLAGITRFDTRVEMAASVICLVVAYLALARLFLRHGPGSRWALVPMAWLLFTLVQDLSALQGFQIAWYMILLAFLLALLALERAERSPGWVAVAVLAAVVASYSSLQGLLVWPAGLAYVLGRGVRGGVRTAWIGAALLTTAGYGWGINPQHTGGPAVGFALHHPLGAATYLLTLLGAIVPLPTWGTLCGGALLALAAIVVADWLATGGIHGPRRAPMALIIFGVGFAALATVGRAGFGPTQAHASRYTTYTVLVLIGVLWGVVLRLRRPGGLRRRAAWFAVPALATAALVVLQVATATPYGLRAGPVAQRARLFDADLVVNYRSAPPVLLRQVVFPVGWQFRRRVPFLARHRLSVFAGPLASAYRRAGVVPQGLLAPLLPAPTAVRALLQRDPAAHQAWQVLSDVAAQRPDLWGRLGPPGRPQERALVAWALGPGLTDPLDGIYLRPHRASLAALARALAEPG